MPGSMFKHAKKRNSGLLYEFLVRRLGKAMVEEDKQSYQKTLEILRRYYSEGTVLCEERELFEVIRGARGLTESAARSVLVEVQRYARKMDIRKLDIKKSCLIKELNHSFGPKFYSEHRIPDYRLLASIQMVVDACRGSALLQESVAKIQLEEGLVRYMTSKGTYAPAAQPKTEVDALVLQMAAKKFEERYSKALCPAQKSLLERYIRYQATGDFASLSKAIEGEQEHIHEVLKSARVRSEFVSDPEMMRKLDEADERFAHVMAPTQGLDQQVEDLMLFQRLVEEMSSDE